MAGDDRLSRREAQVARLYAEGRSYKDIADLLCIAPATVRTHLNTIYRKLQLRSKIQLARHLETEPVEEPTDAAPEASADPAVVKLLRELDLHQYAAAFATNAVDDEILLTLGDSDLRELGVVAIGHRKRLLAAIEAERARRERADQVRSGHAQPGPPAAVGQAAERRHLTILFVDLVGSTELSARLDPEQMRDLLDDYYRAVAQAVETYDGHIANVMGDGMLVYFGWPRSHEDDALRAVWSALAVKSAVEALRAPDGGLLALRIGIASGLVVVGEGMGQPGVVVGDIPNLAFRLQCLARPGQIVVSANSVELVRDVFEIAALGARQVKGLPHPVKMFEVRGPHANAGRFEARIRQGLTGIVGRTLELGLLEECWRRSVAGEGQVVLLAGEPGIGKSRVLQALRSSEKVRPRSRATVHCSPYHTQAALHPFARALERSLAEPSLGDTAARRAKLRCLLGDVGSVGRGAFPALARLLSIAAEDDPPPTDAQEERRQTLEGLADLLLGAAEQQPRLLLIEDAHWIDPTSRELVNRLVDLVPMLPVLVVITARPEFMPSWRHGSHVTALNLGRLDPDQAALLVDRIAAPLAVPPEMRARIVAKADGIPLFIEEMTKTLVERDSRADGAAAGGGVALEIPETLHDTLMARLNRTPAAKAVAQTAAVIGRQFGHRVLGMTALWPSNVLEDGLEQLVQAGLLIRRGRPPDATYLFKHSLIRDAAYQSLLRRDRQRLHGAILRALERAGDALPADGAPGGNVEAFPVLARHASLAELWPEAARYYHLAGESARALWAIDEAIDHFRAALQAFTQSESRQPGAKQRDAPMSTTLALCECLYFSGRFRESFDLLDRSEDELAAIEDRQLRGRAWCWLARLMSRIGRRGPILRLAERAIADSLSCGDKITTANAYNVLCVEHFFTGSPDDSVAAGRRAIDLLARDGPSEAMGFAYHYISMAHVFAGRFRLAIDETARVLEVADVIDHPRLACYGRAVRGWSLGMSGRHQEGLRQLAEASGLAPDEATRIFTVGYTGCVQLETGAFNESAVNLNEAYRGCLAFPSPQFAALFGALLADALRHLGQVSEASAVAAKSLEVGRAAGARFGVGLALRAMARLALARSERARAVDLLVEAAAVLSAAGASFELARTYADLASIEVTAPPDLRTEPPYAERAERLLRRLGLASGSPGAESDGSRPDPLRRPQAISRKFATRASANSGSLI
jgi:class 3 adenylate cyclase/DNA-binding CsgD family transcriptional regulator/tetratricopeptide (TPR) repeat protein